jgi:hypothetical protein
MLSHGWSMSVYGSYNCNIEWIYRAMNQDDYTIFTIHFMGAHSRLEFKLWFVLG